MSTRTLSQFDALCRGKCFLLPPARIERPLVQSSRLDPCARQGCSRSRAQRIVTVADASPSGVLLAGPSQPPVRPRATCDRCGAVPRAPSGHASLIGRITRRRRAPVGWSVGPDPNPSREGVKGRRDEPRRVAEQGVLGEVTCGQCACREDEGDGEGEGGDASAAYHDLKISPFVGICNFG